MAEAMREPRTEQPERLNELVKRGVLRRMNVGICYWKSTYNEN